MWFTPAIVDTEKEAVVAVKQDSTSSSETIRREEGAVTDEDRGEDPTLMETLRC